MSEQTPDTNNGMPDGQDPSMEDILASIRKIIADDDVQAQGESPIETPDVVIEAATEEGDLSDLAHIETLDLDIIAEEASAPNADIDALIGDMDVASSDSLSMPEIVTTSPADEGLEDILDLEIPMDDVQVVATETDVIIEAAGVPEAESFALEDELVDLLVEADDEIITKVQDPKPSRGLMGGAMAALGLGGVAATAKTVDSETLEPPAEDNLSLMLDNMLEDSASYQEESAAQDFLTEERIVDPAEDLLADIDLTEETTKPDSDPDMDLVKSLMADLTEEPLHEDVEDEAVKAVQESVVADIDDDSDASSDDVMDEILSMSLDDETKLSEEIAIPEIKAPVLEEIASESLSLKDIAAAAEADAQISESIMGKGLAVAAGIGVVGTAALTSQDDAPDAETDDVDEALSQLDDFLADDTANLEDLKTEPHTPEHITEETPEMARAKKTDAIIDEVTETATAGAFASLTSVVEEKATVAERGDRIGDLVMEALQPMLKEWLDANLKGIVERAVTKEVKRISSGK